MKRIITLIFLVASISAIGFAASGNEYGYETITTAGTHVINFPRKVSEIKINTFNTLDFYINFTGDTPTVDHFFMGRDGQVDIIETVEEVQSSVMSILVPAGTPNIRIQYKYWAR